MSNRGVPAAGLFLATDFGRREDADFDLGDPLLAINAGGTRVAVSREDADRILVFDLPSGREVARAADLRRVSDVRFLTDDVLLLTHFGGCFRWDLRRGGRELLSEQGWQSRT